MKTRIGNYFQSSRNTFLAWYQKVLHYLSYIFIYIETDILSLVGHLYTKKFVIFFKVILLVSLF